MKALNEDLKSGNLKQIYLFYGAESYLRRQYLKRFKQALISDDDEMNYHYYEGNDTSVSSFIDIAETLPFFADRRVIIWENSGLFKSSDEKIFSYLKAVPESTSILFVEAEIDKRGKMFKLFSSLGSAVEFPVQNEDMLKRWIGSILKKENKQITERAATYLLNKVGTEMENIHTELEKLICYCLDKDVITEVAIDEICTPHITNHIFDMIEAVAGKRQQEALRLYYDLLALKEPPMRILFLITRQFNLLFQVKELKGKGFDNKSIGTKINLPGFVVGKYTAQATKFKMSDLKEAICACAEAEEAVKRGNINDRMSVELLIVKYST
ncbi:MAG: DNA polymerase III subunit delta [Lachnospiraceae bacterium]|nr:DNA polymerase III subunit delta [Lachnospiraceae bacterium]